MWAINEVWRFAAAVVVGLLAVLLVRDHRRDASARATVFLLATVAAHLVFPLLPRRSPRPPGLHLVLLLSLAVPIAFWQAMLADFSATLDKFNVPAADQGELVAIVNSTKADIVVGAKASSK